MDPEEICPDAMTQVLIDSVPLITVTNCKITCLGSTFRSISKISVFVANSWRLFYLHGVVFEQFVSLGVCWVFLGESKC